MTTIKGSVIIPINNSITKIYYSISLLNTKYNITLYSSTTETDIIGNINNLSNNDILLINNLSVSLVEIASPTFLIDTTEKIYIKVSSSSDTLTISTADNKTITANTNSNFDVILNNTFTIGNNSILLSNGGVIENTLNIGNYSCVLLNSCNSTLVTDGDIGDYRYIIIEDNVKYTDTIKKYFTYATFDKVYKFDSPLRLTNDEAIAKNIYDLLQLNNIDIRILNLYSDRLLNLSQNLVTYSKSIPSNSNDEITKNYTITATGENNEVVITFNNITASLKYYIYKDSYNILLDTDGTKTGKANQLYYLDVNTNPQSIYINMVEGKLFIEGLLLQILLDKIPHESGKVCYKFDNYGPELLILTTINFF